MKIKPNILVIFTDMQRSDTINALGNKIIMTPSLNWLVHEGTSFVQCYTPSPVCVSARCSMHYGKYPSKTGCSDNQPMKKDNDDSFVFYLQESGYYTHSIGKCHFAPDTYELRGFQTREIQEEIISEPERDNYLQDLFNSGYSHIIDPHGVRGEMYYIPQLSQMPLKLHPTNWIGDRTINFIEAKAQNKDPWYLFSSFIHPHPPFALPSPWHKLYRSPDMPLPLVPHDVEALWTEINRIQNRYKYRDQGIDNNLMRLMKAYYYGCISFVDYQIGRILKSLEKTNQLDNTVIIFTSDHGEHLGDYNCFGKRSMHSTSSRVPMIIRYPGAFQRNKVINKPVSLVDISSTCLDLADINFCTNNFDGESLRKLSNGDSKRDFVFSQWNKEGNAQYMCAGEHGIYFYSAADDKEFYFNHKVDPLETRNKAYTIGEGKNTANNMKKKLLNYLKDNEVDSAFEKNGTGVDWKRYKKFNHLNDPDRGLIFQDHPWAIDDIEGYGTSEIKKALEL